MSSTDSCYKYAWQDFLAYIVTLNVILVGGKITV